MLSVDVYCIYLTAALRILYCVACSIAVTVMVAVGER
jgi:hypothetical protein